MTRPHFALALAIVALAAPGCGRSESRVESRSSAAPAPQAATPSHTTGPASGAAIDVDAAPPPVTLPPLSPTAEWLAAPPNAITVTATTSPDGATQRITPGGGTVSTRLPNGTRVTLQIPPGALLRSTEITLTPVTSIAGLPFADGGVGAVRIAPDDTPLLAVALLRFESRQPVPSGRSLAGFAIRGEREFHLYPAARLVDPRTPAVLRAELRLDRVGTYGVALATEDEVSAAARRRPTDHLARLEQRLAEAFPPVKRAGWSLVPVVHAGQLAPGWLDRLFAAIDEGFEQLVVPRFKELRSGDCTSYPAWTAIQNYYVWMKMPDLMMPILDLIGGPAAEEEARLREQRRNGLRELGYSDAEIDAISAAMDERRRAHFDALKARGNALVADALRLIFTNAHTCCTQKQPMQYYVNDMMTAWHEADLRSISLDAEPMARVEECTCRVASQRLGSPDIFTGTITHAESFSAAGTKTTGGSRTETAKVNLTHRERIVLERPLGPGHFLAYYDVTASYEDYHETREQRSCGVLSVTGRFSGGPWRDSGETEVHVEAVPNRPGTYRISYAPLGAEGLGSNEVVRDFRGCQQFHPYSKDVGMTAHGVAASPTDVTFEVQADPRHPFELKGEKTFEDHDPFGGLIKDPRHPKVSWNLQRCSAR